MYFCVQNGLRTEVIAVRSINCLSYTVEKEFVFCTVRTEPLNAHQEMFNFTPHVEGTDDGVLTWHSLLSGLCQLFNIPKMKELSAHRRLPLSVLRWKGVESSYPPETHRREHSPPPPPSICPEGKLFWIVLMFVFGFRNMLISKKLFWIFFFFYSTPLYTSVLC